MNERDVHEPAVAPASRATTSTCRPGRLRAVGTTYKYNLYHGITDVAAEEVQA